MGEQHKIKILSSDSEATGWSFQGGELKPDADIFEEMLGGYTISTQASSGPTASEMPIQKLYPNKESRGQELENAIRLLSEASQLTLEALEAVRKNDAFESEDLMQRNYLLLCELFCCRALGDGFGMMVNALCQSHINLDGVPYDKNQISEIRSLLGKLLLEPFLPAKIAIEEIVKLEKVGLLVEPKGLKELMEELDE